MTPFIRENRVTEFFERGLHLMEPVRPAIPGSMPRKERKRSFPVEMLIDGKVCWRHPSGAPWRPRNSMDITRVAELFATLGPARTGFANDPVVWRHPDGRPGYDQDVGLDLSGFCRDPRAVKRSVTKYDSRPPWYTTHVGVEWPAYDNPIRHVHQRTGWLLTQCHQCTWCKRQKAKVWTKRALSEWDDAIGRNHLSATDRAGARVWLFTGTFAPWVHYQAKIMTARKLKAQGINFDTLNQDTQRAACVREVYNRIVSKFLKRLRKGAKQENRRGSTRTVPRVRIVDTASAFRYLGVCERHNPRGAGANAGEIHVHILLYETDASKPLRWDSIRRAWQADTGFDGDPTHRPRTGIFEAKECKDEDRVESARYVTKYMVKSNVSPRVLASQFFGDPEKARESIEKRKSKHGLSNSKNGTLADRRAPERKPGETESTLGHSDSVLLEHSPHPRNPEAPKGKRTVDPGVWVTGAPGCSPGVRASGNSGEKARTFQLSNQDVEEGRCTGLADAEIAVEAPGASREAQRESQGFQCASAGEEHSGMRSGSVVRSSPTPSAVAEVARLLGAVCSWCGHGDRELVAATACEWLCVWCAEENAGHSPSERSDDDPGNGDVTGLSHHDPPAGKS